MLNPDGPLGRGLFGLGSTIQSLVEFNPIVVPGLIEITFIRVSVVSLDQISGCCRSGLQYSAWSVARTRFCIGG